MKSFSKLCFFATGLFFFSLDAFALGRDIKCSDDGRVCLECFYKDNGELLYCDIWILPKVSNVVFEPRRPLQGKNKAFAVTSRTRSPGTIGMSPSDVQVEDLEALLED